MWWPNFLHTFLFAAGLLLRRCAAAPSRPSENKSLSIKLNRTDNPPVDQGKRGEGRPSRCCCRNIQDRCPHSAVPRFVLLGEAALVPQTPPCALPSPNKALPHPQARQSRSRTLRAHERLHRFAHEAAAGDTEEGTVSDSPPERAPAVRATAVQGRTRAAGGTRGGHAPITACVRTL